MVNTKTTPGNQGEYFTQMAALDYTSYNYETSKKRPDSYGVASGDFDGAGGSFGIIQYNWKSGTCQGMFKDMFNLYPDDIAASITNTADYNTFYDVVFNRTTAEQMSWGSSITDQTNKHKLIEPWNTYFITMGTKESYQNLQIEYATPYLQNAKNWCSDFGLWTRRGYGLMFDISVQFGGISTAAHTDIMNFIAAMPTANIPPEVIELRKMRYIADRTAQDHAGGAFSGSAYDRKRAIANGSGNVYGYPVYTTDYDLILEPNGFSAIPAGKVPKWLHVNRTKGK
jgi:hypothetical protein